MPPIKRAGRLLTGPHKLLRDRGTVIPIPLPRKLALIETVLQRGRLSGSTSITGLIARPKFGSSNCSTAHWRCSIFSAVMAIRCRHVRV